MEVNRRRRRAQSAGLDVRQLLSRWRRYAQGERHGWQVGKGPSVEAEEQRHLHRDLDTLKPERASTTTRIRGLLRSQGLRVTSLTTLPAPLEAVRRWDGAPMPPGLRRRVRRVYAHHTLLSGMRSQGRICRLFTTSVALNVSDRDSICPFSVARISAARTFRACQDPAPLRRPRPPAGVCAA